MKTRLPLALLLAALLAPALSGCFPALVAGTAAGVISLHDRRTTAGVRKVINVMEILSDADINRLNEQALLATKKPAPATPAPSENR